MTSDTSYRNQTLWIPNGFRDDFLNQLVGAGPDEAFYRQVDLWWYALRLGVASGERTPLPSRPNLTRFNDADILQSDPWRRTHLELLVLGERGVDAACNPTTVVATANEYAMTGFRLLAEELRGQSDYQIHLFSLLALT